MSNCAGAIILVSAVLKRVVHEAKTADAQLPLLFIDRQSFRAMVWLRKIALYCCGEEE